MARGYVEEVKGKDKKYLYARAREWDELCEKLKPLLNKRLELGYEPIKLCCYYNNDVKSLRLLDKRQGMNNGYS